MQMTTGFVIMLPGRPCHKHNNCWLTIYKLFTNSITGENSQSPDYSSWYNSSVCEKPSTGKTDVVEGECLYFICNANVNLSLNCCNLKSIIDMKQFYCIIIIKTY